MPRRLGTGARVSGETLCGSTVCHCRIPLSLEFPGVFRGRFSYPLISLLAALIAGRAHPVPPGLATAADALSGTLESGYCPWRSTPVFFGEYLSGVSGVWPVETR